MKILVTRAKLFGYEEDAFQFTCPACIFKIPWDLDKGYVDRKVVNHIREFHRVDRGLIEIVYDKKHTEGASREAKLLMEQ